LGLVAFPVSVYLKLSQGVDGRRKKPLRRRPCRDNDSATGFDRELTRGDGDRKAGFAGTFELTPDRTGLPGSRIRQADAVIRHADSVIKAPVVSRETDSRLSQTEKNAGVGSFRKRKHSEACIYSRS